MGSICIFGHFESIKDFADKEIKYGENFEILDQSIVGNVVYRLVLNKEKNSKFIAIVKITYGNGEWCYKSMDESMGPYYYDCPERILKKSDSQYESSINWRNDCRAKKARNKERKEIINSLKAGDVLKWNDYEIVFCEFYRGSKSKLVCRSSKDGILYLYSVKNFTLEELKYKFNK